MASVKCPKCGNITGGVQAGQTVKCPDCGNMIKIAAKQGNGAAVAQQAIQTVQTTVSSTSGGGSLKVIGILLIVLGVAGIGMGTIMFGDIGIACFVGAAAALLSGIGFFVISGRV